MDFRWNAHRQEIDPGVARNADDRKGHVARRVQDFLYRDCGLKGLSGVSNDA
jgi:acetate kinase